MTPLPLKRKHPKREELFAAILKSLNELPHSLRQIFFLSHYEGHSAAEIARRVPAKEQDIAFLLRRANRLFYLRLGPFIH